MTIKVTQADREAVRQIRLSDQVWYQQDRVARHRIEAQRSLIEALGVFTTKDLSRITVGDLRRAEAAIKQAKGE